jgi:transposase
MNREISLTQQRFAESRSGWRRITSPSPMSTCRTILQKSLTPLGVPVRSGQARVLDAAFHHSIWRPADYDGHHARSEALFYYFRLEEQVPENHLLRLIDQHTSFEFVRERLKDSDSETGRPSIDPELLLRILLIGYWYGISSERKLGEELRMHLAWRWFTGLSFDQEIPHHSTFSKNRHGRFQESKLFGQWFEHVVRQCVEVGLVQGTLLSVDGSLVEANAAKASRIPREQLVEAAQVHHSVREYLVELEQQNPVEEPVHEQDLVSTTDPDSTYATKGGTPARLGYYDNYLVDNASCVIVGVQATAARQSQETVAGEDMLTRFAQWQGRKPESVGADTTYGNGEFLQWLAEREITPYMRTRESAKRKNSVVGHACKNHNARVDDTNILRSTGMSWPGKVPASWPTHQSSPTHSGKEQK